MKTSYTITTIDALSALTREGTELDAYQIRKLRGVDRGSRLYRPTLPSNVAHDFGPEDSALGAGTRETRRPQVSVLTADGEVVRSALLAMGGLNMVRLPVTVEVE